MTTKTVLQAIAVAVDALPEIQKMTGVGGDKAALALSTIGVALDAVIAGLDGTASPQEVLARVEQLAAELAANDATANAALDAKFSR